MAIDLFCYTLTDPISTNGKLDWIQENWDAKLLDRVSFGKSRELTQSNREYVSTFGFMAKSLFLVRLRDKDNASECLQSINLKLQEEFSENDILILFENEAIYK